MLSLGKDYCPVFLREKKKTKKKKKEKKRKERPPKTKDQTKDIFANVRDAKAICQQNS